MPGLLLPILIMVFLAHKPREENIMANAKATAVKQTSFFMVPP
jgi:hypothetical protein